MTATVRVSRFDPKRACLPFIYREVIMELTKCDIHELLDLIQTEKDKLDALTKMYEDRIEKLRYELQLRMANLGQRELTGTKAKAVIKRVKNVAVSDWDDVQKYVKTHDAFDILQCRISPAAAQARIDAGEVIPGLTVAPGDKLMITKIKTKDPKKELL
jgi:Gp157 protein